MVRILAGTALLTTLIACGGGSTTSQQASASRYLPMATATAPPTAPPPITRIRNTWGRIGAGQVFDYFPTTKAQMSSSQISADASRYDMVWGSFNPGPWRSANSAALVGRYYIPEEDNSLLSGHTLAWWQQNHPDWMLYACTSSGTPTQDLAYVPGVGFNDVVLDIHN